MMQKQSIAPNPGSAHRPRRLDMTDPEQVWDRQESRRLDQEAEFRREQDAAPSADEYGDDER